MMNGKGMLVICGNSVAELEQELEMLKLAISTGATMGCGGATINAVEKSLSALMSAVDTANHAEDIEECNCVSCGGNCGCCCGCDAVEDEEMEYDSDYDEDEDWDYPDDEDEDPTPSDLIAELMDNLENRGELTSQLEGILSLLADYL